MKRFISSFINIWVRKWKACVQFEQVCATSAQAGTESARLCVKTSRGKKVCATSSQAGSGHPPYII